MLSILIPTYNYSVAALVQELHRQAQNAGIVFEIMVYDDASPDTKTVQENTKINGIPNCRYKMLPSNIGRSAIRNLLADNAQYDWLLFLDADTIPVNDDFISNYLPHFNNEEKVIYGSIKYQPPRPPENQLLRWVYGNEREALSVEIRKKEPYLSLLTLNFAIRKSVFAKVRFNEEIPNLRYEDTLFSYDLMKAGIKVEHISNEVYHLGLETSEKFITKSEEATEGLYYLINNKLIDPEYIKISRVYRKIAKAGLKPLAAHFHAATKKVFCNHLLSSNPSLFIFDLYRLGYLCSLKK